MPIKLPGASVVIPSWNGAAFVADTLKRISLLRGIEWEALVIDHGRLNRDTQEVVKSFAHVPQIRYVGLDEQLGFAGAVNCGVREARHNFVAVICNDVLVEPDWLAKLVEEQVRANAMNHHPVLSSVVARAPAPVANGKIWAANFWMRVLSPESRLASATVPFPDGSAFLFDRSFYGLPFDADYFLYQEDVYLGWRAWLIGESVYVVEGARVENFDGGPHAARHFLPRIIPSEIAG